jgi:hypothetical protein
VEYAIDGTVVNGIDVGTVTCVLDNGTVICALDEVMVACTLNNCMGVCVLDDALFLLIFLLLEVDSVNRLGTVQVSAAAGDMKVRSLTRLPVMVIDGDDMEHFPCPNVDVYRAVSN